MPHKATVKGQNITTRVFLVAAIHFLPCRLDSFGSAMLNAYLMFNPF